MDAAGRQVRQTVHFINQQPQHWNVSSVCAAVDDDDLMGEIIVRYFANQSPSIDHWQVASVEIEQPAHFRFTVGQDRERGQTHNAQRGFKRQRIILSANATEHQRLRDGRCELCVTHSHQLHMETQG